MGGREAHARQALARTRGAKYCSICRREKTRTAFYNNHAQSDGLSAGCKECLKRLQSMARRLVGYVPAKRKRRKNRRYGPKEVAQNRRYRQTVVGRLVHDRSTARWKIKTESNRRRQFWELKLQSLDALIARAKKLRDRTRKAP